jgi:carboxylesterase type B
MKTPFALPFAALALLGGIPVACELQLNTLVHTTNGAITGHAAPGAPEVTEFLGIPYAKPPVGRLRFAAPERDNLQRTYNASDFVSALPVFRMSWQYQSANVVEHRSQSA